MVTESVEAFLDRYPSLREEPEAAAVLRAAAECDNPKVYGTALSNVMNTWLRAMDQLRALVPEEKAEMTPLDEIRAQRDKRLGRESAAAG